MSEAELDANFAVAYATRKDPRALEAFWNEISMVVDEIIGKVGIPLQIPDSELATLQRASNLICSFLDFSSCNRNEFAAHEASVSKVKRLITVLGGAMRKVDDYPTRLKIYSLVERCLDDDQIFETVISEVCLVAVFHCLDPPDTKDHKLWAKKLNNLSSYIKELDVDSSSEFYCALLNLCKLDFLAIDEGRKFLGFLISMSPTFAVDMDKSLRRCLSDHKQRRSTPFWVGDVYVKAIQASDGAVLQKLQTIVQSYVSSALRYADGELFRRQQAVLDVLHGSHEKKVLKLLNDAYSPILLKGLFYPKDIVRRNALSLFARSFPLHNPDSQHEELNRRIEEQFQYFQTMIADEKCPSLRGEAVEAVCVAIKKHLDLISMTAATPMIELVFNQMIHDTSDYNVRARSLKGVYHLLQNAALVGPLKEHLPKLRPCLWDVSVCVRLAFMSLLSFIKSLPSVAFWDVVPVTELLERMSTDPNEQVAQTIVHLLLDNFIPTDERRKGVLLERCLFLINLKESAATRFYSGAAEYLSEPKPLLTLLGELSEWLSECCKRKHEKQVSQEDKQAQPSNKRRKTEPNKQSKPAQSSGGSSSSSSSSSSPSPAASQPSCAFENDELVRKASVVACCLSNSIARKWPSADPKLVQTVEASYSALQKSLPEAYACEGIRLASAFITGHSDAEGVLQWFRTASFSGSKLDCQTSAEIQSKLQPIIQARRLGELVDILQNRMGSDLNGAGGRVGLWTMSILLCQGKWRSQFVETWKSTEKKAAELSRAMFRYMNALQVNIHRHLAQPTTQLNDTILKAINMLARVHIIALIIGAMASAQSSLDDCTSDQPSPSEKESVRSLTTETESEPKKGGRKRKQPSGSRKVCSSSSALAQARQGSIPAADVKPIRTPLDLLSFFNDVMLRVVDWKDEFREPSYEMILFWIDEMLRSGVIRSIAPQLVLPEQTNPIAEQEETFAKLFQILSSVASVGSRRVQQRFLTTLLLLLNRTSASPVRRTAEAIQILNRSLKTLNSCVTTSSDVSGLLKSLFDIVCTFKANAADLQLFFTLFFDNAMADLTEVPDFENDPMVTVANCTPLLFRIAKKLCGISEFHVLLKELLEQKASTDPKLEALAKFIDQEQPSPQQLQQQKAPDQPALVAKPVDTAASDTTASSKRGSKGGGRGGRGGGGGSRRQVRFAI